jgi:hypothetical protein
VTKCEEERNAGIENKGLSESWMPLFFEILEVATNKGLTGKLYAEIASERREEAGWRRYFTANGSTEKLHSQGTL